MKKRKILALVMVALLSLGILVGCSGKKDAVTGKWNMTKAKYSGIEQSAEDLKMSMTLNFKDGKVTVSTSSEGSTDDSLLGESEYKLEGNKVTITDDDGTEMTAAISGDTMLLTQNDVEFTLVREGGSESDNTANENSAEATQDNAETTPAATAE